jgi:hypothetical protein
MEHCVSRHAYRVSELSTVLVLRQNCALLSMLSCLFSAHFLTRVALNYMATLKVSPQQPMWPVGDTVVGRVAAVVAEVAGLFPEPTFHLGGDEATVRVFRQKFKLEDAIEFHAFAPLEALPHV